MVGQAKKNFFEGKKRGHGNPFGPSFCFLVPLASKRVPSSGGKSHMEPLLDAMGPAFFCNQ